MGFKILLYLYNRMHLLNVIRGAPILFNCKFLVAWAGPKRSAAPDR